MTNDAARTGAFITRWSAASGSERANYQLFVTELCDLLGTPKPDPASDDTRDNAYVFERRVQFAHGDGTQSNGFIDCYQRGRFVLEAKKVRAGAHTKGFDDALLRAASANWREVEPAIFGTLLERALSVDERHALGAHYTPRAYVERLVLPTIVQPLRADWADAQAAAVLLANEGKLEEARAEVRRFHHQLCTTRVLDPACGSGNFLYVTLEHLKRLEGEVLNQLQALGETQDKLGFAGETVTLQQLLGIEINPRASALAELVLWIGFLQWHIRTFGDASVAEPVIHDYGNIECRDAVLAYDSVDFVMDAGGKAVTRWDGEHFKKHPVTGEDVPDEAFQTPLEKYTNPRKALWPKVDFNVGNPPFIGASTVRRALGDGYVDALRATWSDVPESADFVMHWWHAAAQLFAGGSVLRFGLITTNSLSQTFNRRVVERWLATTVAGGEAGQAVALMPRNTQKSVAGLPRLAAGNVSLVFAIPDHPWVDNVDGAAVRISMTAGAILAGGNCSRSCARVRYPMAAAM